jgi:GTP-dependent phosphoenolpyruvate carboxykinase
MPGKGKTLSFCSSYRTREAHSHIATDQVSNLKKQVELTDSSYILKVEREVLQANSMPVKLLEDEFYLNNRRIHQFGLTLDPRQDDKNFFNTLQAAFGLDDLLDYSEIQNLK